MDLNQLQEEFRKLESDAGKKASSALLQIIELKMSDFKTYIDERFKNVEDNFQNNFNHVQSNIRSLQWTIGIGFTLISLLIVALKLFA